MPIKETLNITRGEQYSSGTLQHTVLHVLLTFVLGIILGFLAKYSEVVQTNGLLENIWDIISALTTRLGVWVLIATILAVWSKNPKMAATRVFTFFVGMLLVYYIYSMWIFGFFPTYYFMRWGVIALASPVAAYIVWYSKGAGWTAAFCAAMPIGLLVAEGYPFFYTYSITFGIELLFAIILFFMLQANKKQGLRKFVCIVLLVIIIRNSNALTYIFGGL